MRGNRTLLIAITTSLLTYAIAFMQFYVFAGENAWDHAAPKRDSYQPPFVAPVQTAAVVERKFSGQRLGASPMIAWNESSADFEPHLPPYSDKKFVYTVLTTRQFHGSRLKNIMRTWGQHVNIPFITTDALDPAFPTALVLGAEGKGDLGGKTLQALKKFCEFDSDFYVFTDDDSFVVAKNLESVIAANYDRDSALYAGYTLTHTVKPFVGGGGGIVFSNNTIKNFCAVAKSEKPPVECSWEHQRAAPGDMAISHCMNYLGVAATHQHGFYPFPITELMKERDNWCNVTWWVPKHLKCNPPVSRVISFHYVPEDQYRMLYYFLYLFRQ